jgi:hypothetical protein
MNAFLVMVGVAIVGLIIALWAVKKFNVKTKVFGVPLQYVLDVALLIVALVAVLVIKTVLGGKSKTIEALLAKLNMQKAQNNINIVNNDIKTKTDTITAIDQQIKTLQPATQKSDIDALIAQQNAAKQELEDLNKQKQTHTDVQTTLQQKIQDLAAL